ncbi:MAG: hypothetical protein FE835_19920, partial [Gammaproteobacteria bacterium]|nr:hypothetical protein [Gammaproteobacteria bacterium]
TQACCEGGSQDKWTSQEAKVSAIRVREVKSTRKEVALVSKFKGGIGAVSQGFVDANPGKVNMVKTGKISRPLCVITKGDPDNELGKVIAYLKTDQAKKYFK